MASIDMLMRLNTGASMLRSRMEVLTRQVTSGQKAQQLGDLSPNVTRASNLRAEIDRRDTYGKVIDQALGRTGAVQQALSRLTDIAREFGANVASKLDPNDPQSVTGYANRARAAMVEVANLLNTRYAGEYVFGGSDIANPPVPDPGGIAASGMATDIATAVGTLAAGNVATVQAATMTAASSDAAGTTPFSTFLSTAGQGLTEARRALPSDDGTLVTYGVPANRNGAAVSAGADTTGSWARDLLRGLASIAALTPAKASAEPQAFTQFAGVIKAQLTGAETTLADEAGQLGTTEATLEATRTRHSDFTTVLQTQLANVTEVDLAEALTKLQGTQTALEASYRAIAQISGLSLTKFL